MAAIIMVKATGDPSPKFAWGRRARVSLGRPVEMGSIAEAKHFYRPV